LLTFLRKCPSIRYQTKEFNMWWIDSWGNGFAAWFGPEMVELFQTQEEAEAFVLEMRK